MRGQAAAPRVRRSHPSEAKSELAKIKVFAIIAGAAPELAD
jgi:hypothetical protein